MKPFDLVHSDLWGPYPISSITGSKYFLLFIDYHTRFTWFYLLQINLKLTVIFLTLRASLKHNFTQLLNPYKLIGVENSDQLKLC